eukprot:3646657-Pleurochrysis_carterae.AAC.4
MSQLAGMPSACVSPAHHPQGGGRDVSVLGLVRGCVPRIEAILGVLSSHTSATASAPWPQI